MDDTSRELDPEEILKLTNTAPDIKRPLPIDNSPEALAASMREHYAAIESEFANIEPDSDQTSAAARKKLFELIPDAGTTIHYLLVHAESETVRANLAKFVYTEALRTARAGDADDDFSKLIRSLQSQIDT